MDLLKMSAAEVEKLPLAEALEVLAAHVRAKQAALPEQLAASKAKELARAAKKALYQLKSNGVVVVPPPSAPAAAKPVEAKPERSEFPALLSAVLGTGERAIFLGRPMRGGLEVFQAILHDEYGVQQLDRAESSRAAYRQNLRAIRAEGKVLEVPLARVLTDLSRGWAQNLRAKNGPAAVVQENLRRLGLQPDESLPPVPPPEPGDEALAEKGAALHGEPELAAWLPPEGPIAALSARIEIARKEEKPDAAVDEQVRASAAEFWVGSVRQLYARRLWLTAEFFGGTGRPVPAGIAAAEARRLFHLPPGVSPFGIQFFAKVVSLSLPAARPALRPPGL